MHLPPEVERLVPGLIARVGGPEAADAAAEAQRIETLILAGDPVAWLGYLRERGALVRARAAAGAADPVALVELAGILRDQLALIQAQIDLGPDDLALLAELEELERSVRS